MAMDENEPRTIRVVVADAGPFIHLDELGCLDLLADFKEVLIHNSSFFFTIQLLKQLSQSFRLVQTIHKFFLKSLIIRK